MKKWMAGLLAAIVGPVAVWVLINKVINPTPRPRPQVTILALGLEFPGGPLTGAAGQLAIDVFNGGNSFAARCKVTWNPGPNLNAVTSAEFGLTPAQRLQVTPALLATFPRAGTFTSSVSVGCVNPPVSESAQSEPIVIKSPAPAPTPTPTPTGCSVSPGPVIGSITPKPSGSITPKPSGSITPKPSGSITPKPSGSKSLCPTPTTSSKPSQSSTPVPVPTTYKFTISRTLLPVPSKSP